MPFPTFSPPGVVNVSPGSSVKVKPRVRVAGLGDGYAQRSGDGLNSINRTFAATFSAITGDEADTIIAFFEERAGYRPFLWTLPGEATALKWSATEWQKTYSDDGSVDITATFEQVFDPG